MLTLSDLTEYVVFNQYIVMWEINGDDLFFSRFVFIRDLDTGACLLNTTYTCIS